MVEISRTTRFFIEESGSTGDVVRTGIRFDFDRQPLFVLACLGLPARAPSRRRSRR